MAAWEQDQPFRLRGGLERLARPLAGGQAVVRGDDHEQRGGGDALEVLAGLVALEQLERAKRHLVAPGGPLVRREELVGVGRREGGLRHRVGMDHGQHRGRLAACPRQAVGGEHVPCRLPEVHPHERLEVAPARDQRHLAADGLDASVDRPDDVAVRARVARAPHRDPGGVDLRTALRVGDRVLIVAHLFPRVDFLARLARRRIRGAEAAIVVDHAGQPRGAEHLGVVVEMHLLGGREPVCHDDARHLPGRVLGAIEPPAQRHTLSAELDVFAHGLLLLDALRRC